MHSSRGNTIVSSNLEFPEYLRWYSGSLKPGKIAKYSELPFKSARKLQIKIKNARRLLEMIIARSEIIIGSIAGVELSQQIQKVIEKTVRERAQYVFSLENQSKIFFRFCGLYLEHFKKKNLVPIELFTSFNEFVHLFGFLIPSLKSEIMNIPTKDLNSEKSIEVLGVTIL